MLDLIWFAPVQSLFLSRRVSVNQARTAPGGTVQMLFLLLPSLIFHALWNMWTMVTGSTGWPCKFAIWLKFLFRKNPERLFIPITGESKRKVVTSQNSPTDKQCTDRLCPICAAAASGVRYDLRSVPDICRGSFSISSKLHEDRSSSEYERLASPCETVSKREKEARISTSSSVLLYPFMQGWKFILTLDLYK